MYSKLRFSILLSYELSFIITYESGKWLAIRVEHQVSVFGTTDTRPILVSLVPYSRLLRMANVLIGPSTLRDIICPQFHQNNFPEENFIKNELGIKLDKGMSALPLSLTIL